MLKPTRRRLTLTAIALSTFVALPAAGQTINEDLKLTASDGAIVDLFGRSIAVDNGIIAVGAYQNDDNGFNSGSAYLFDASTGEQLFKLIPSDGAADDWFGWSIAIDNGVVAVGAFGDDDNGINSGSAYLFDAITGVQIAKLLPIVEAAGDQFGRSTAINNGIVAVGAPFDEDDNGNGVGANSGSVYLFDASTGAQLFKLFPIDGKVQDFFGRSTDIDNDVVAIGAPQWFFDSPGSAYLFNATTGEQLFKLLPNDSTVGDQFGYSIAIDNGVVAVGAYFTDDNGNESGSVYLFDASTGAQIAKLLPSDGTPGDQFGSSIAIDNGVVAVGAWFDDNNGGSTGSAYLFNASTGTLITKLLPSDGALGLGNQFGSSIAIDNGLVAVGALADNDNGFYSGSAYLFTTPNSCPGDLNDDGTLNFFDVSAFITALAKHDPIADFTNDGRWNFFDVSAFLQAFAQGCP